MGCKANQAKSDKAKALLRRSGLYAYRDCHPTALSGGQKQQLSITCGILSDRQILILDEPASGTDGGNMTVIADVLAEEAHSGKTILAISHDVKWNSRCCSHVYKIGQKQRE